MILTNCILQTCDRKRKFEFSGAIEGKRIKYTMKECETIGQTSNFNYADLLRICLSEFI